MKLRSDPSRSSESLSGKVILSPNGAGFESPGQRPGATTPPMGFEP